MQIHNTNSKNTVSSNIREDNMETVKAMLRLIFSGTSWNFEIEEKRVIFSHADHGEHSAALSVKNPNKVTSPMRGGTFTDKTRAPGWLTFDGGKPLAIVTGKRFELFSVLNRS